MTVNTSRRTKIQLCLRRASILQFSILFEVYRFEFWTDFKYNGVRRNLWLSACLVHDLKAERWDEKKPLAFSFWYVIWKPSDGNLSVKIGLALGRSEIELSTLVSLLYAQVNVQRKIRHIVKIRRFQLQERQHTAFHVKIHLF